MLRCAPSKVNLPCHSEERSDEESAFVVRKKQIPRYARNDTWGTFIPIGGPKVHVTLGMTDTLFQQPDRRLAPGVAALSKDSLAGNVRSIRHLCATPADHLG
jgi:hypothetical protein